MALPPSVAPNELIQSSWGNSVVSNLTRVSPLASYHFMQSAVAGDYFAGGNLYPIGTFVPQTTGKYLVSAVGCFRVGATAIPVYFTCNLRHGPSSALGPETYTWFFTGNAMHAIPLLAVFDCTAGVTTEIQISGFTGTGNPPGQAPATLTTRYAYATRVQTPTV